MHAASFLNRARNSRCTVITDLDTSKRSTQKAFYCCDAMLETGPAVSMRSELLVAHEKLGQLPLLRRCTLCPCKVRNKFLVNFWNRTILLCIPCILEWFKLHSLRSSRGLRHTIFFNSIACVRGSNPAHGMNTCSRFLYAVPHTPHPTELTQTCIRLNET